MTDNFWPTEIRLSKDKRSLHVTFEDGCGFEIPAELLRVNSPSAEVQGHAPDQRRIVSGKKNVTIVAVLPVGSYAVRLRFDDGHDTGIFTWAYLRDLGENKELKFQNYLAELQSKNLPRA